VHWFAPIFSDSHGFLCPEIYRVAVRNLSSIRWQSGVNETNAVLRNSKGLRGTGWRQENHPHYVKH